jgi:pyruvate formate lyase activating enzyme
MDVFNRRATPPAWMDRLPDAEVISARAFVLSGRRRFLESLGGAALGAAALTLSRRAIAELPGHPARFYKKLPQQRVECQLCPKLCRVDDTERGFCGVRENHGGEYRTLVYGRACAMNVDPIEKKPFFHVWPGSFTFSIATAGCNMDCKACQNWQISQSRPEQVRSYDLPPEKVVQTCIHAGSKIITFTYTEPTVFIEYVLDTARLARKQGLRSCMVTGGNIEVAPLKEACGVLDAIKVDLKSFSEQTYVTMCKGHLAPILRTLETVKKEGRWLEIVYLVIPTVNDTEGEIRQMSHWVKKNLGLDVPVHLTRFHPEYQLKHLPPTPYSTLKRSSEVALAEGLRYVYVGNIVGMGGEDTICPTCHKTLVERRGFSIRTNSLTQGKCPHCATGIPGLWS